MKDECIQGVEVLWVGLHGFAAGLVVMVAGLEYLSPQLLTAVLTGTCTFLANLSQLSHAPVINDWAPLIFAAASVGALAFGGARLASGESFLPPALATGYFPMAIMAALAGHIIAAYETVGFSAKGVEEWIPLFGAAMAFGLMANGGSRLSGGQSFLPPALLEGYTPRAIMISLAAFTTVSLFSKLEGKTGHWQDWAQLLLAAAGFGVLAYGGNEFGQGRPFLDPALAAGPVPAAVMAILGGFTWSAFHVVVREGNHSFEDWAGLVLAALCAGVIALGGARCSQDLPFMPDLLAKGSGPLLVTGLLAAYTFTSLYGVAMHKGDFERWMTLSGAATVVGGLSYYGVQMSKN